jgi:hypothetical protein
MKKLKQIDEFKGSNVGAAPKNAPGDALVTRGEIPDLNCLSCNQNISPFKVEKIVEDQRSKSTFGTSPSIGIGLGSAAGSNTARLFPKRSTNVKMAHVNQIMEESIYTKKEMTNRIFENNENL